MTINAMCILQKLFLITIPIASLLTSVAMLMPYWWTSDTFQVGLWRARSLSSAWINVTPDTDTHEGRLLFTLQILSFISVLLTNLNGLIWLATLLRRTYHTSLISILLLLFVTILVYFCLSTMIFFVWYSTTTTVDLLRLSYSFYLTILILLFHTTTLISITINLAKYRTIHHTIQPNLCNEKISFAFNDLNV